MWFVVHDICLPAYRSIGVAFPCLEVNIANSLDRGFAVLQAPSSATHVIVVPTAHISGIESPALQSENAPNYWQAAWDARRFVEEGARRHLPRDTIGVAINAPESRSQDQLHIHVSCIASVIADFLRDHQAESLVPASLESWWTQFRGDENQLLTQAKVTVIVKLLLVEILGSQAELQDRNA